MAIYAPKVSKNNEIAMELGEILTQKKKFPLGTEVLRGNQ
jgi:hypothetical protein